MHPSARPRASLLYKQVRVRMGLISARARVHVLVVMSRSERVSITSDGPQEMLAARAGPGSRFSLFSFTSAALRETCMCARALGDGGAIWLLPVEGGGCLGTSVICLTRARIK